MWTAFDVVPIRPDGKFTTDPIPPGKYEIAVYATSAQRLKQPNPQYDYDGRFEFTVPDNGEMPEVVFDAQERKQP